MDFLDTGTLLIRFNISHILLPNCVRTRTPLQGHRFLTPRTCICHLAQIPFAVAGKRPPGWWKPCMHHLNSVCLWGIRDVWYTYFSGDLLRKVIHSAFQMAFLSVCVEYLSVLSWQISYVWRCCEFCPPVVITVLDCFIFPVLPTSYAFDIVSLSDVTCA